LATKVEQEDFVLVITADFSVSQANKLGLSTSTVVDDANNGIEDDGERHSVILPCCKPARIFFSPNAFSV
jgi:hypothetical protein